MKNIWLSISYDGTNFYGYQKQNKDRTVQSELDEKLEIILNHKVKTFGAGRTDRGVHAINQIVNFTTDSNIPAEGLFLHLKNIISLDICVQDLKEVPLNFHARFSAIARAYIYKMKSLENFSVFDRNYYNFIKEDIDTDKFNEMIEVLKGKNDFKSFARKMERGSNTVREILDIKLIKRDKEYEFYIKANGFLRGMVRIIIASSLLEYFGERPNGYLLNKLKNPNHADEKFVAKAHGLYLYKIFY